MEWPSAQDGSTLYVAQDNQDQIAVINTATNKITHKVDTRGPSYLDFPANTHRHGAACRHGE